MIAFPANADMVVVHTPVSFACGIDGMCRYCRVILSREPMERAYFLFINKRREKVRVLWYDGQGFVLCMKRLSHGTFKNWPKQGESYSSIATFFQAHALIAGGEILTQKTAAVWKNIL
jgi:transposase